MSQVHTLTRALPGDAGYKRLARLVARAFYAGECPPREEEGDEGTSRSRSKARRRS